MTRRFGRTAVVLFSLFTMAAPGRAAAQPLEQPKIAIVDFDARPGGTTLPPPQIGATIAQLMLDRLVEANRFQVFDGQWLRKSAATSRQAEDALLAGARDAGVDYLVLGSITQFSMEQRQRTFGGGGFLRGLPIGGGSRRQTSQLAVSILVRVMNVQTGQVVTTAIGVGVGKRSGLSAGGLAAHLPLIGGLSSGSSNSRDAQLDEAARQAVDVASAGLVNAAPRLIAFARRPTE
jgi:curli biogenesis system outer membrane secretion channel CsgG